MSDYRVSSRLELFPATARIEAAAGRERLTIAGVDLGISAGEFGTPLYLYDQATLDTAVASYQNALSTSYPGEWNLTYAGKAWLCIAMAQWIQENGLWLDCSSGGELAVAAAAGMHRAQIVVHGVNKRQDELASALELAGTLVVDNLDELDRVAQLMHNTPDPRPNLWLRLRPGVAVATHAYIQTGQEDSKFGMSQADILEAARVSQRGGLPLTGLHFHLGSQFRNPEQIGPALERVLDLMEILQTDAQWSPEVFSPGGGWGMAYHEDELPHPPISEYVKFIAERLVQGCRARGLALPRLQMEPGRSLVARAGVALYQVGLVKQTTMRRWLLLDGGLADNPRPALYGARYSALPVEQPRRPSGGGAWLAGPYCESGDVLIEDLPLPHIQPGELIAVPMSGAYQLSMASNYNMARRPAVVWLNAGTATLIQRRESVSDLLRRDIR